MTDPRKAAFDGVRAVCPNNPFNDPGNVHAFHNLLDAFGAPREAREYRVGPKGKAIIQRNESCKLTAYPDPGTGGKPWTIGWGTTVIDGRPVRPGETITQAQADALFEADLARFAKEVEAAIGDAPTTQEQFDALVSFHYNTGKIASATLTRKHKARDYEAAAAEFGKWVFAGGKKLNGLVRRRAEEAVLYRSGGVK